MIAEDLLQVARFLSRIQATSARTILLLSPNRQQYNVFREKCPGAKIYCADKHSWDLSEAREWKFDFIFAGNVMMYSTAPAIWFKNILQCTHFFLVQDLVTRRRSNTPPYLGSDHDATRYQYRERGVTSEFSNAYDLGCLSECCEFFSTYSAGKNATHFVGLFRGALTNNISVENWTAPRSLFRSTMWFRLTGGGLGRI